MQDIKRKTPDTEILLTRCKDSAPTEKHHNSNQTTTITNVPAIKQQRSMQPQTPQLTRSSSRRLELHFSPSPKPQAPASPILFSFCKDSAPREKVNANGTQTTAKTLTRYTIVNLLKSPPLIRAPRTTQSASETPQLVAEIASQSASNSFDPSLTFAMKYLNARLLSAIANP